MLLPQFSGQQLLRKGINETGGARRGRQPGRDRGRGGGRRAEVGGRAPGFWGACLHVRWCACSPRQPSDSERGCVLGGWVCHGKINDFLSDFRGGETRRPSPSLPAASPRPPLPQRDHTDQPGPVLICFVFPAAKCLRVTVPAAPLSHSVSSNTNCVRVWIMSLVIKR